VHGPTGVVYIADTYNHRIRRVTNVTTSSSMISTVAGIGVSGSNGDGIAATNSGLSYPCGIAVDPSGNLFITELGLHSVRVIYAATGTIHKLAGTGSAGYTPVGPATSASFNSPFGVALDMYGAIYVADFSNGLVRRISGSAAFAIAATAAPTPAAPTPSASPSHQPAPADCPSTAFRGFPRMDLVGTLVGSAPGQPSVGVASEAACRIACCAAGPTCEGYSFDTGSLRYHAAGECFLFANVTQLMPANMMASGVRESTL
jgi:hypothetical protein